MLLDDTEKIHENFLKKYPDEKISLSAFRLLKPQECISAGAKGTHNVCVCKIHGNFKLKLKGLKQEFARKNVDFATKSQEYFEKMTCSKPSAECFLGNCKKCPATTNIIKNLKASFENLKIKKVSYTQWLTTDRY